MDEAVSAVQTLVEAQIKSSGESAEADRLTTFKQQAAAVARAKSNAADKLQDLSGQLRSLEAILADRQREV